MYFVYMIKCKNKSLYTGMTNNLERRFKEHKNKTVRYTSYNPPIKIVYTEQYPTRSEACKQEARIKSWTRKKKLALIKKRKKVAE